jgi:hypothetical protein
MKKHAMDLAQRLNAHLAPEPRLPRATVGIKVRYARIRAVRPSFYINGHVAEVGEEAEFSLHEAKQLQRAGKAEILEEFIRDEKIPGDLHTPPRSWATRW